MQYRKAWLMKVTPLVKPILAQSLPQINSSLTISRSATWGGIYNATRLPKIYNNNSAAGIKWTTESF